MLAVPLSPATEVNDTKDILRPGGELEVNSYAHSASSGELKAKHSSIINIAVLQLPTNLSWSGIEDLEETCCRSWNIPFITPRWTDLSWLWEGFISTLIKLEIPWTSTLPKSGTRYHSQNCLSHQNIDNRRKQSWYGGAIGLKSALYADGLTGSFQQEIWHQRWATQSRALSGTNEYAGRYLPLNSRSRRHQPSTACRFQHACQRDERSGTVANIFWPPCRRIASPSRKYTPFLPRSQPTGRLADHWLDLLHLQWSLVLRCWTKPRTMEFAELAHSGTAPGPHIAQATRLLSTRRSKSFFTISVKLYINTAVSGDQSRTTGEVATPGWKSFPQYTTISCYPSINS